MLRNKLEELYEKSLQQPVEKIQSPSKSSDDIKIEITKPIPQDAKIEFKKSGPPKGFKPAPRKEAIKIEGVTESNMKEDFKKRKAFLEQNLNFGS